MPIGILPDLGPRTCVMEPSLAAGARGLPSVRRSSSVESRGWRPASLRRHQALVGWLQLQGTQGLQGGPCRPQPGPEGGAAVARALALPGAWPPSAGSLPGPPRRTRDPLPGRRGWPAVYLPPTLLIPNLGEILKPDYLGSSPHLLCDMT